MSRPRQLVVLPRARQHDVCARALAVGHHVRPVFDVMIGVDEREQRPMHVPAARFGGEIEESDPRLVPSASSRASAHRAWIALFAAGRVAVAGCADAKAEMASRSTIGNVTRRCLTCVSGKLPCEIYRSSVDRQARKSAVRRKEFPLDNAIVVFR